MLVSGNLISLEKPSRIRNCIKWSDNSRNKFPLVAEYSKELKNILSINVLDQSLVGCKIYGVKK